MVAAVAGCVAAAALPSPRATKVALDPDHELIAACDKWNTAFDKYNAMWAEEQGKYGWDFDQNAPSANFWESTVSPLVDFIQETRPTTLAGVAAKAKFIRKYFDGSCLDSARPFFDELGALGA